MSDADNPAIHIYDMRSGSNDPLDSLPSLHAAPVTAMRFSEPHGTVISTDQKGAAAGGRYACVHECPCWSIGSASSWQRSAQAPAEQRWGRASVLAGGAARSALSMQPSPPHALPPLLRALS